MKYGLISTEKEKQIRLVAVGGGIILLVTAQSISHRVSSHGAVSCWLMIIAASTRAFLKSFWGQNSSFELK